MKLFKKIILIFAVALAFLSVSVSVDAKAVGVDFRNRVVKYILDDPFVESPNTFEAVIKIEKNTKGDVGYIFGNTTFSTVSVNYRVDENGHLVVEWDNYQKLVTFESTDLRTGVWEHVGVVRNITNNSFDMYLNGELVEVARVGVGEDVVDFSLPHTIGGDFNSRNYLKIPFQGWIKQVTVYSKVLNADEMYRDYLNPENINYTTREGLMFNGILSLGDVVVEDTSMYRNNAYLASNDYFYDGELFEAFDYTLAILPDIQMATEFAPKMVDTIPGYVNSIAEKQKIEMMITVGDLTNGGNNAADWKKQYSRIANNLNKLTMPYVAIPGNHDYDDECSTSHSLNYFNDAFPVEKAQEWACWGGTYNGSVCNAYYLLTVGGVNYIIFAIDFGPSDEVLQWCCELTEQYSNRRTIVVTHGFLSGDNRMLDGSLESSANRYSFSADRKNGVAINDATHMWDKWLRKYDNIFMVFCGHTISDDIAITQKVGDHGNVVSAFLVNGQGLLENNGLEALVALFNFDEANQRIYINYVSCISEKLYNIQNQFVLDFGDYTPIKSSLYVDKATNVKQDVKLEVLSKVAKEAKLFDEVNVNVVETQTTNFNQIFGYVLMGIVVLGVAIEIARRVYKGGKYAKKN